MNEAFDDCLSRSPLSLYSYRPQQQANLQVTDLHSILRESRAEKTPEISARAPLVAAGSAQPSKIRSTTPVGRPVLPKKTVAFGLTTNLSETVEKNQKIMNVAGRASILPKARLSTAPHLSRELEEFQKELTSQKLDLENANKSIASLSRSVATFKKENQELRQRQKTSDSTVDELKQQIGSLVNRLARLENSVEETTETVLGTSKAAFKPPETVFKAPQEVHRASETAFRAPQTVHRAPEAVFKASEAIYHTAEPSYWPKELAAEQQCCFACPSTAHMNTTTPVIVEDEAANRCAALPLNHTAPEFRPTNELRRNNLALRRDNPAPPATAAVVAQNEHERQLDRLFEFLKRQTTSNPILEERINKIAILYSNIDPKDVPCTVPPNDSKRVAFRNIENDAPNSFYGTKVTQELTLRKEFHTFSPSIQRSKSVQQQSNPQQQQQYQNSSVYKNDDEFFTDGEDEESEVVSAARRQPNPNPNPARLNLRDKYR